MEDQPTWAGLGWSGISGSGGPRHFPSGQPTGPALGPRPGSRRADGLGCAAIRADWRRAVRAARRCACAGASLACPPGLARWRVITRHTGPLAVPGLAGRRLRCSCATGLAPGRPGPCSPFQRRFSAVSACL